jgi:hypothetical protein
MRNAYSRDKVLSLVANLGVRNMVRKNAQGLWRGAIKIYQILLEKEATWGELKRETGFSATILSQYLRDLQEGDWIYHKETDRKYAAYKEPYQTLYHQIVHSTLLYHEAESFKPIFKSLRIGNESSELGGKAIRAYVMILAASVPALVCSSVRSGEDVHQRLDNLVEVFMRPWIHTLLDLCLVRKNAGEEITEDISKRLYQRGMQDYENFHTRLKGLSEKTT